MFSLTRDDLLNHCPRFHPLVICQPISKFDVFTFIVSHTMCSILFFTEEKSGTIFKGGRGAN